MECEAARAEAIAEVREEAIVVKVATMATESLGCSIHTHSSTHSSTHSRI